MGKIAGLLLLLITFVSLANCANFSANQLTYGANDELVVLAHGLGRSKWAMWKFAQRLRNAHFKVCLLDYSSIGQLVPEVLEETTYQIDKCLANAPKVHFVGHSLGGLVIRAYLQTHQPLLEQERMGKVVLIGTPNQGSEVADSLSDSWLMYIGGGVSRALVTGAHSLGSNLVEIDAQIGVIAGTESSCLTRDKFSGPNDGLVSVESTKLKKMKDFITIDVNHSQMRYNEEVAKQTILFLQTGAFTKQ